ncbi:PREDICTED: uncharacterized protein LOC106805084 [Priapulus caudatus]|uniref:Uncharacterized protein LOC106805084 n=1 Tax=Priapulus caudatus TaxID=37621 RepID=A0ABM1DQ27_PRICU|nr:PREDICTED: uncharacterized protein LOC106805084 [Priapulus caudatus]
MSYTESTALRSGGLGIGVQVNLPPLVHSLPHWSRMHHLERRRYQMGLGASSSQYLGVDAVVSVEEGALINPVDREPDCYVDAADRAKSLEKSVTFLRKTHTQTLDSLHAEIDKLKKDNKDLQFKYWMRIHSGKQWNDASTPGNSASLVSELHRLKADLQEERALNNHLMNLTRQPANISSAGTAGLPARYSLRPLLVNPGTTRSRAPNMQECSAIINHVVQQCDTAQKRYVQLREVVQEVLCLQKFPPDGALLDRLNIAIEGDSTHRQKLPNLPSQSARRQCTPSRSIEDGSMLLPPINHRPTRGQHTAPLPKIPKVLQNRSSPAL